MNSEVDKKRIQRAFNMDADWIGMTTRSDTKSNTKYNLIKWHACGHTQRLTDAALRKGTATCKSCAAMEISQRCEFHNVFVSTRLETRYFRIGFNDCGHYQNATIVALESDEPIKCKWCAGYTRPESDANLDAFID